MYVHVTRTVDLEILHVVRYKCEGMQLLTQSFTSVMVANGKFLISFIPLSKLVKLWINENDSIMLSAVCIILKS